MPLPHTLTSTFVPIPSRPFPKHTDTHIHTGTECGEGRMEKVCNASRTDRGRLWLSSRKKLGSPSAWAQLPAGHPLSDKRRFDGPRHKLRTNLVYKQPRERSSSFFSNYMGEVFFSRPSPGICGERIKKLSETRFLDHWACSATCSCCNGLSKAGHCKSRGGEVA